MEGLDLNIAIEYFCLICDADPGGRLSVAGVEIISWVALEITSAGFTQLAYSWYCRRASTQIFLIADICSLDLGGRLGLG